MLFILPLFLQAVLGYSAFRTGVVLLPLAMVLAALIGFATLRLSGVYFVIFTLGLAEMIRNIVSWVQNNFLGSRGLYVLTDFTEAHIYWMLLAISDKGAWRVTPGSAS